MSVAAGVERSPIDGDGPTIPNTVLATGRRKIAEAMQRVADVSHDAVTIAILRVDEFEEDESEPSGRPRRFSRELSIGLQSWV